MKKTVVCQLALGYTRVSGYTLYDHESMAFEETTPRDVKYLIKSGVVNGLILDKEGNILPDEKGFNCKNLIVKSGVGNYRLLYPVSGMVNHGMYALTKVADTDDGLVYEVVSHQCARLPITESKLRALYQLGCLCGCWIKEGSGMIEFAKGVEFVDMTSEAIKARQAQEEGAVNGSGASGNDVGFGQQEDGSIANPNSPFADGESDFVGDYPNGYIPDAEDGDGEQLEDAVTDEGDPEAEAEAEALGIFDSDAEIEEFINGMQGQGETTEEEAPITSGDLSVFDEMHDVAEQDTEDPTEDDSGEDAETEGTDGDQTTQTTETTDSKKKHGKKGKKK